MSKQPNLSINKRSPWAAALPLTDNIKGAIMTLFPGGKQKKWQKGVKEKDERPRTPPNDALIIRMVMYCLWKFQCASGDDYSDFTCHSQMFYTCTMYQVYDHKYFIDITYLILLIQKYVDIDWDQKDSPSIFFYLNTKENLIRKSY